MEANFSSEAVIFYKIIWVTTFLVTCLFRSNINWWSHNLVLFTNISCSKEKVLSHDLENTTSLCRWSVMNSPSIRLIVIMRLVKMVACPTFTCTRHGEPHRRRLRMYVSNANYENLGQTAAGVDTSVLRIRMPTCTARFTEHAAWCRNDVISCVLRNVGPWCEIPLIC